MIKKSPFSTSKQCTHFGNFVDSRNLHDINYIEPFFTWQEGSTIERLDRALANDAWLTYFPQSLLSHLSRIKSDHRPILLKTHPICPTTIERPFRFLVGWTKHAQFPSFIKEKWNFSGDMAQSLSNLTMHIKN